MAKKKPKKTNKEIEKKVVELAKKGLTAEKIGLELKKEEIYPKEQGLKINQILKDNNLWEDPDLKNISTKVENLKEHINQNSQDKTAKHKILKKAAKLSNLKKYRSK